MDYAVIDLTGACRGKEQRTCMVIAKAVSHIRLGQRFSVAFAVIL
jgi:hypothetical protein